MTYLSHLAVNPRNGRARKDLSDCHEMHRTVMNALPAASESARQSLDALYRIELDRPSPSVLLQSGPAPNWSHLPDGYLVAAPECKRIDDQYAELQSGQRLRFRLRANPTKRLGRGAGDAMGKRVELRTEEDQLGWLRRKGEQGGFEMLEGHATPGIGASRQFEALDVRTSEGIKVHGRRTHGAERAVLTFGSVLFDGELRITDSDAFRQTLLRGVGSGKAYGFGLLSIAPVR